MCQVNPSDEWAKYVLYAYASHVINNSKIYKSAKILKLISRFMAMRWFRVFDTLAYDLRDPPLDLRSSVNIKRLSVVGFRLIPVS